MRSKILVIFLLFSMLTACASNKDKESALLIEKSNTGNYDIVIPYEMSSTREYHTQYANSSEDFDTIGSRLLEISKEYFPTNEYVLGEGSVITYNRLIQLVGRESDTQEMGLNPRRGENLDIGVKGVEMVNAVLIRDVVEQDFYKMKDGQAELAGISLCVVLNPVQDVVRDGKTTEYTLSDDFLFDYGTMMSRKLDRYMRTLGESRDVPILITLYVNGESGSYVPGYMLGKALFKDRTPSFERMNEKWVLFPSNEATSIDSDNTAQFSTFKSALSEFIEDDVGVVGIAFYEENTLQKLNITVQYTHKTYVELVSIIQYCSTLLETFGNDTFDIMVHFKNQSQTKAIVLKYAGSQESIVVSMN
ncbi:MAG: hypothetical protein E7191_07305 [Erysipelotrichaceae bacterium]|nr:hypothetical protein [Erysipelotrichaceae bacterium]